jgi:hypothetical protein
MLESRALFSVRLSSEPPLRQLRTAPTEPHVSAKARMRNRIRTASAALLSDPSRRHAPSLGEFFGGQNFEEWAIRGFVLCSELCSSGYHRFLFKEIWCMAVRRTAIPRSVPPDAGGGSPAFGHFETRGILAGVSSAGNTHTGLREWKSPDPRLFTRF